MCVYVGLFRWNFPDSKRFGHGEPRGVDDTTQGKEDPCGEGRHETICGGGFVTSHLILTLLITIYHNRIFIILFI